MVVFDGLDERIDRAPLLGRIGDIAERVRCGGA
jgi:hypothetical protein